MYLLGIGGLLILWIIGWIWVHEEDPSLSNKNSSLTDYAIRLFIAFMAGFIAIGVGIVSLFRRRPAKPGPAPPEKKNS
ncbi:hypothetical protein HY629_00715 [Candidatus Uhrbacteria bacterium]|nr:hypothetical protein [Candidatus Uhrbacteria bacterium]